MIAAAALVLVACLIVLGVALYLLHHAHEIRRETDRTLANVLSEHARERREDKNRMMHLADRTWELPPLTSDSRELEGELLYPLELDPNPEGAIGQFLTDAGGAV